MEIQDIPGMIRKARSIPSCEYVGAWGEGNLMIEKINRVMEETGLHKGKQTAETFVSNARVAALKVREITGESFAVGTPSWRWGLSLSLALEVYVDAFERINQALKVTPSGNGRS